MKKSIINSIFLSAAFACLVGFTSCHDDIYGAINNEIELNSSGLQGDMHSIVHYKNYILTCNGEIFYKTNEPSTSTNIYNGQWEKTTSPTSEKGDNGIPATTYFLAADSQYLYALTYIWVENDDGENEPKTATIYATESDPATGLAWTKVENISGGNYSFENAKVIFDNKYFSVADDNSVSIVNRKAYARIRATSQDTYKLYELNGSASPVEVSNPTFVGGESDSTNAISACYFNSNTYFSKYYGMTSNDKCLYYTKTYTRSNNVNRNSSLYYITASDSNEQSVDLDAGGLLSIAAAKDYILLGTSDGLARVAINETTGIPNGDTTKMAGNGGSVISEYVFMVFVLNPNKKEGSSSTEEGTDEYASSTIYGSIRSSSDSWDDTGLYAWYPAQKEWNRDGD
ncbi:hypothetical protein [uncultured Treponema sp.]|uniref:hypothetical protein n=1 Tax=uncultured Treponema sp. TaxID=162155 RepID=UPI0025DF779F|nr:hypothetical protein [uncultured Treponema sp.]